MKKYIISTLISSSLVMFTGCFGNTPEVIEEEDKEIVEVVEDKIIEENIELIEIEEDNSGKTAEELGNELLLSLIDYYSSVYKLRSVGLDNVSEEDAKMVGDLRASIDRMISDGADVNYKDEEGSTPIYISVINDDKRILEKLIEKGAALDTKTPEGRSLLAGAVIEGSIESANVLLDNGTDPDGFLEEVQKPVNIAVLKGVVDSSYISLAEKLINLGAEPNVKIDNGDSILLTTIKMKSKKLSLALIKNGADVNFIDKEEISALNWAIILNENDTAKAIVKKDKKSAESKFSLSPLVVATVVKNDEMYEFLKGEGLKVTHDDKGWASLKLAETLNEKEIQDLLNGIKTLNSKPQPVVMKDSNVPISSMKFLSVNQRGNEVKVFTDDNLQKKFILKKPFRVVLDFTRFNGARNYMKKLNGEYLSKVQVGRHESFYRVVLHMKKGRNATISQENDGVKVVVK